MITGSAGRGLLVQELGEYAAGPRDQPQALVVGYGRWPDHDDAAAVSRLVQTWSRHRPVAPGRSRVDHEVGGGSEH